MFQVSLTMGLSDFVACCECLDDQIYSVMEFVGPPRMHHQFPGALSPPQQHQSHHGGELALLAYFAAQIKTNVSTFVFISSSKREINVCGTPY